MKSIFILLGTSSWCLLSQHSIASKPSSCEILMYKLSTSNKARILMSENVVGRWLRKSILSLIKLLKCLVIGFKIISMRLLSLCVLFLGSATIGLNLFLHLLKFQYNNFHSCCIFLIFL